jgi:hypothetical protein
VLVYDTTISFVHSARSNMWNQKHCFTVRYRPCKNGEQKWKVSYLVLSNHFGLKWGSLGPFMIDRFWWKTSYWWPTQYHYTIDSSYRNSNKLCYKKVKKKICLQTIYNCLCNRHNWTKQKCVQQKQTWKAPRGVIWWQKRRAHAHKIPLNIQYQ